MKKKMTLMRIGSREGAHMVAQRKFKVTLEGHIEERFRVLVRTISRAETRGPYCLTNSLIIRTKPYSKDKA